MSTNVFRDILEDDYQRLPAAVRDFHDHKHPHFQGTAFSGGATHWIARLLRRIFGFPKVADTLTVEIWLAQEDGRDVWRRKFGDRRFSSSFHVNPDGTLDEKFGPFRFAFRLRVEDEKTFWDFERWRMAALPLPKFLGPRIVTYETEAPDGAFEFYSHADFPVIGRLVHYHGWVHPANDQNGISSSSS